MKTLSVAAIFLCVLVLSRVAGAHTLTAPATVQASGDGTFSYVATFTVGPGSFLLADFGWNSSGTSPVGFVGDCFCDVQFCTIAEGFTIPIDVSARLANPTQAATVTVRVQNCFGVELTANTTVQPAGQPVSALPAWGAGLMALALTIIGLRASPSTRRPV